MNKSQFIEAMAGSANISKAAAAKALDGIVEAATKALKNEDKVTLVGFGTFSVVNRAARKAKNGERLNFKSQQI